MKDSVVEVAMADVVNRIMIGGMVLLKDDAGDVEERGCVDEVKEVMSHHELIVAFIRMRHEEKTTWKVNSGARCYEDKDSKQLRIRWEHSRNWLQVQLR